MKRQPSLAVVGGTGLTTLFAGVGETIEVATPYGSPSALLNISTLGDKCVAFLPRHGNPHRIPPHKINYRANLWALHHIGVRCVIAVNAVGGIRREFGTGSLVVPDQLIDYSWGREHTYFDGEQDRAVEHIDFTEPFDTRLRENLLAAARDVVGVNVFAGGVYGVTQGPRLETAAEIDRMASDGCDVVGMTAMPEAGLARELGMAYASLCLVVNPAAGRGVSEITQADMHRVVADGMQRIRDLLVAAARSV